MTKHSPGPWSLSGDLIVGAPEPRPNPKVEPYGHAVAKLCWDFDGDHSPNGDLPWVIAKRNGLLICAAPQLLAACQEVLRNCELFRTADNMADRLCRIVEPAIAAAEDAKGTIE